jgi:hypothetical protein
MVEIGVLLLVLKEDAQVESCERFIKASDESRSNPDHQTCLKWRHKHASSSSR